jgi:hypothetical protein
MTTHPVNRPLRQTNPLRDPLADRRNASWMEWSADLRLFDLTTKHCALRDPRAL